MFIACFGFKSFVFGVVVCRLYFGLFVYLRYICVWFGSISLFCWFDLFSFECLLSFFGLLIESVRIEQYLVILSELCVIWLLVVRVVAAFSLCCLFVDTDLWVWFLGSFTCVAFG